MKTRIISVFLAFILLASLLPVSALADAMDEVSFTVCADSDAGLGGNVTVDFKKSSDGYTGTLHLPGSADISKLHFTWDKSVTVSDGSMALKSGEAPVAEAGGSVKYTVTAGGRSAVFTVKTMKGSVGVEGLFFNIDESLGTISAMYADKNHNTECFGSFSFDGETHDMSIKGRGNSTWTYNFSKKPLNFTVFKNEDASQGIGKYDKKDGVKLIDGVKAKKWSLLANAKDSSLLRNKLGYDMAKELGIGLDSRFVDVWMNGEYIGNYLMTPKTDYNAPENGYLLEIDNKTDYEDPQFTLNMFSRSFKGSFITVKDNGAEAPTADIKAYMEKAASAIQNYSSSDYLNYIDLDSWAKMYLLHELYKDIDVVCGSKFMYRNGLSDSDKLVAGPVWDLDGTFGRTYANGFTGLPREQETSTDGWFIDSIQSGCVAWFVELGKHEDFMQRVYELYNENKALFDSLPSRIDEQAALIADSAEMNFDVDNVNQTVEKYFNVESPKTVGSGKYAVTYKVTRGWSEYVDNLRTYVNSRLAFLEDSLLSTAPEGSITGNTRVVVGDTLLLTADVKNAGDATYQWQLSDDGESWTDIKGETGKTLSVPVTADMNGRAYRCEVTNARIINTARVAKACIPPASAVLDPVSVSIQTHPHSYAVAVTKPDCTHNGYTSHVCKDCGDYYKDTFVSALGHDYRGGVCTRCGAKESAQPEENITTMFIRQIEMFFPTNFNSFLFRIFGLR